MKLQINERGAWRTLAEFPADQLKQMKAHGLTTARAVGLGGKTGGVTYRITRDGRSALAYLESPYKAWRNA